MYKEDKARRLKAGIPEDVAFRPKLDLSPDQLRGAMAEGGDLPLGYGGRVLGK
ncbi:MAG: transposase [Planctomycetota bacterium]|jgi:hypothetical protein|nr:transposase [Planctomycetota bacterium]